MLSLQRKMVIWVFGVGIACLTMSAYEHVSPLTMGPTFVLALTSLATFEYLRRPLR